MALSLQSMYDRSPVPAQHAMVSASGYQRNRSRYGRAGKLRLIRNCVKGA